MQQLYINGNAVDMPTEEIKIKVESNLFSDAGSIMTAHSYSMTLPRTMRNDSLMAMAYVPSSNTGGVSTHRYLSCSLHIDRTPLFLDGRLVVNEVGDKGYKCNLYWGLLGIFELIKDEGLNLCDLPSSQYVGSDLGVWVKLTQHFTLDAYVSGMSNDIYNTLDDESKSTANKYPWGLPVATANDMFSLITAVYGITFDISAFAQAQIDKLYHPLTTLKSLAQDEECVINLRSGYVYSSESGKYLLSFMTQTINNGDLDYYTLSPLQYDNPPSTGHSATNEYQANNSLIAVSVGDNPSGKVLANAQINVKKVRVFGTNVAAFSVEVNGETFSSSYIGGVHKIDHTFTTEFSAEYGGEVVAIASPTTYNTAQLSSINVQIYINDIGDTETGMWWNYVRNYPQMQVIDYLNEILAHIGGCMVGCVTERNAVRIVRFDEVAQKTPITLDTYGLKSIKMTMDDLAQKNIYTHKENEDNGYNYKGEGKIYTYDTTLELSRTAFESNFRVPQNSMVRLWKVEKDPDDTKYKATWAGGNDYICGWDANALTCRNTGQGFDDIIAAVYQSYRRIVERPKVIEAVVRMSIFDLKNFNFEKPVNIPQLGRSYLVKSIDSDKGEQYKLTLIQM